MVGDCYICTDNQEFKQVLDSYIDKYQQIERTKKIKKKYSDKYKINGELTKINGKNIHIDYLPSIDEMINATNIYKNPREIVGSALYKIEKDECLFLTDITDFNLERVYNSNKREADALAKRLYILNTEEFDYQMSHTLAAVLLGSFASVFGQTYGEWRRSLK